MLHCNYVTVCNMVTVGELIFLYFALGYIWCLYDIASINAGDSLCCWQIFSSYIWNAYSSVLQNKPQFIVNY